MEISLRKLLNAKDYLLITVGLVLYAFGYVCFLLPYQITSGGVAGIGALIFYATGFSPSYTYLIINVFLLILAIRILGWKFSIKTIYAVLVLTCLFEVVKQLACYYSNIHPGEFNLSAQGLPQIVRNDAFMSAILGASLEGTGLGIIFLNNGSTGGTDIIAAIVNKYRDITLGQVIMAFDVLIITSSILLPGIGISQMLYGYCTLVVLTLLLDFVVDRGRQSVQFLIFSKKYDEIADAITATGRGVTVLDGEGWYTHNSSKVLVVLAKRRESTNIFRIIQEIDQKAFVSQSKVIGVFGQGFDHIKVKQEKKQKELAARKAESSDGTAKIEAEKNV